MNFRVGQKVVCVDASYPDDALNPSPLVLNAIYTIKKILPQNFFGHFGVQLNEIECPEELFYLPAFRHTRFRPLVEKKTDAGMAILKSILEDAENYKVIENA